MDDIVSYVIGKKKGGVIPTGEIDITQNGITNVSGYATANVNVPQPTGKISITQNGTDIDVSSYASADVNVPAGVDPAQYFNSTVNGDSSSSSTPGWNKIIKKLPDITITGESLAYFFQGCNSVPNFTVNGNIYAQSNMFYMADNADHKLTLPNISMQWGNQYFSNMFSQSKFVELDLSSLGERPTNIYIDFMFYACFDLKKVDLSNLKANSSGTNASYMFCACSSLEELDMSSFDFTEISTYNDMFDDVPTNCLIYVKDQDQVDWFTTNFPDLTNVQIKSQYIANQGV